MAQIDGIDENDFDDNNKDSQEKEELFVPENLSMSDESNRYTLDGAEAFIWEEFLKLLQGTEEEVKAIAANRLSMLKSVTETIKENSALVGAILHMCEKFEVYVRYTQMDGLNPVEINLPIVSNGRYSFQVIQLAVGNLYKKMYDLYVKKGEAQKEYYSLIDKAQALESKNKRLEMELNNIKAVPPPPFIVLPFVIARSIVSDDKPIKHLYITKDHTTSSAIGDAKRFSTSEKAAQYFIELLNDFESTPIKNLSRYQIRSLSYSTVQFEQIPEHSAALTKAVNRAKENKA